MWLYTGIGFFSLVEDRKDATKIHVRSHFKCDLERLRDAYMPDLGVISDKPHADYRFRAIVDKAHFSNKVMPKLMLDIKYPKFKPEVTRLQGDDAHSLYLNVWSLMFATKNTHDGFTGKRAPISSKSHNDFSWGTGHWKSSEKSTIKETVCEVFDWKTREWKLPQDAEDDLSNSSMSPDELDYYMARNMNDYGGDPFEDEELPVPSKNPLKAKKKVIKRKKK